MRNGTCACLSPETTVAARRLGDLASDNRCVWRFVPFNKVFAAVPKVFVQTVAVDVLPKFSQYSLDSPSLQPYPVS